MLYVSTRNKADSFTAYRAMREEYTSDGGLYVPFHLPSFTKADMTERMKDSFSENVASIMNLFFSAQINHLDVDFCVGRYPVKLVPMNHKILVAELWHNLADSYDYLLESLSSKFSDANVGENSWMKIGVGIAVLFGIYAEHIQAGGLSLDIAVDAEDFSAPLSAFYARKMGLPIGNIICCFREDSEIWNFIHHGELNTAASVPENIERFIFAALGYEETQKYLQARSKKGNYKVNEVMRQQLNGGIFAAVVGESRIESIISSVYQSNSYVIDRSAALSFGGVQDYRARTRDTRDTLLLTYHNPSKE